MNDPMLRGIAAAASEEGATREARAQHVATIVRDRRGYRWVGIFDVADDEATLLAQAGSNPHGERLSIPILGAESGIAIGTFDVVGDALAKDDEQVLDDVAAAAIGLFE